MKAAYNQNDLGLSLLDEDVNDDCDSCLFLTMSKSGYDCRLVYFSDEILDVLPNCGGAAFTPEPLSDIFLCESNI